MKQNKIKVAPSILACDFGKLAEEVRRVEKAGADLLHVDVMDGHFVPNLSLGPAIVKSLRPHTKLPLDVHLMVENPERFIEAFVQAGSDSITVHAEACPKLDKIIGLIKNYKVKSGISLNPDTPFYTIKDYLYKVDLILLMTVHPGFGGQKFIPKVLDKIRAVRERSNVDIEVDGGINPMTAKEVIEAGANILVAGTFIFNHHDPKQAIQELKWASLPKRRYKPIPPKDGSNPKRIELPHTFKDGSNPKRIEIPHTFKEGSNPKRIRSQEKTVIRKGVKWLKEL